MFGLYSNYMPAASCQCLGHLAGSLYTTTGPPDRTPLEGPGVYITNIYIYITLEVEPPLV